MLVAQGNEDPPQVTDQSDLDHGGQFHFPDAAHAIHVVESVLAELFGVPVEPDQMQPLVHGRRPGDRLHFVQRRFKLGRRFDEPPPVLGVRDADLQQTCIVNDPVALFLVPRPHQSA